MSVGSAYNVVFHTLIITSLVDLCNRFETILFNPLIETLPCIPKNALMEVVEVRCNISDDGKVKACILFMSFTSF